MKRHPMRRVVEADGREWTQRRDKADGIGWSLRFRWRWHVKLECGHVAVKVTDAQHQRPERMACRLCPLKAEGQS